MANTNIIFLRTDLLLHSSIITQERPGGDCLRRKFYMPQTSQM